MLEKAPKSLRWRQLLPPLFVLGVLLLALMSLFWAEARALLLLTGIFYLGALLFVSIRSAGKKDDLGLIVGMPIAVSIMHFCWGGGFLFHAARRFVSAGSATRIRCERGYGE